MAVIGTCRTSSGECHTLPICATKPFEENVVGAVTVDCHLVTSAVKGNSLTCADLNNRTWFDGEVSRDRQIVTSRVDSNWTVFNIPRCVGCDI